MFCCILLIIAAIHLRVTSAKESEGLPSEDFRVNQPFRLEKFNFAWDKAQRRLNDIEQQSLFVEMAKLDKQALKAKHEMASGKNPETSSGVVVEAIDKKFRNLLKQYKLYDVIASLEERKKVDDDDARRIDEAYSKKREKFSDPKINKLWTDAQKAGFNDDELTDLHVEFEHYEKKQEKLRQLEQDFTNADPDDNSVSKHLDDDNLHGKQDKNEKLKLVHKDVEEDFKNLVNKIEMEKIRSADGEFTHPKVKKLWENALKSSRFKDDELTSLKEELKHFETKLSKLNYVENEMIKSKYRLDKSGKDHLKTPEHKDLEMKYKDYERKIEKMENYLKSKLVHTEL